MQTMNTKIDGSAFTCLDNLVLKLFLHFLHHLLNSCRMDTAIGYKLMESKTAYLSTDRIKGTYYNSLWSIIYNNLHTRGCLKSPDVTTFTTDDTTLYLIILYMEYTDTILNGCLGGHTLYRLDNYLAGIGIGIELSFVHNLVDIALGVCLSLVLHRLHKSLLGLLSTQTREFLKLFALLELHFLQFLLLDGDKFLLIVDTHLLIVEVVLATTQLLLTLVERHLALLEAVLALLDMLVAHLHFLLELALLVEEFLLHLEQLLLFHHFGFLIGSLNHLIILTLQDIPENEVSAYTAQYEGCNGNYYSQ